MVETRTHEIDEIGFLMPSQDENGDVRLHRDFLVLNLESESRALVVVVVIRVTGKPFKDTDRGLKMNESLLAWF